MTDSETTQSTEKDQPAAPKHPWTELKPDRFRLLRLAPLPTERDGGARPLRFVELAHLERHTPEQSLLRMFINIPGQVRSRKNNVLEVWADHRSKELRFGPDNGLQLDPANRGLGRFLLAQGAAWAQKRWSHYLVEGGALPKDVASEDQRLRRDHCLRTQGFDIDYPPGDAAQANLRRTAGQRPASGLEQREGAGSGAAGGGGDAGTGRPQPAGTGEPDS